MTPTLRDLSFLSELQQSASKFSGQFPKKHFTVSGDLSSYSGKMRPNIFKISENYLKIGQNIWKNFNISMSQVIIRLRTYTPKILLSKIGKIINRRQSLKTIDQILHAFSTPDISRKKLTPYFLIIYISIWRCGILQHLKMLKYFHVI